MKRFVMGDIHGSHKGLLQCLERSKFNKEEDLLIQLGDICDGWSYVRDCVDELLTIKNLIALRGNHDEWFLKFLEVGSHTVDWAQGGLGTLKSYATAQTRWEEKMKGSMDFEVDPDRGYRTNLNYSDIPEDHIKFFKKQDLFYKDEDNNLFVHAGFDRHSPISGQTQYMFYWDRTLLQAAMSISAGQKLKFVEKFKNIFIGHSATTRWSTTEPIFADIIVNVDTGAGWTGKLTIMDVDTKEYWQSDLTKELYPNEKGR